MANDKHCGVYNAYFYAIRDKLDALRAALFSKREECFEEEACDSAKCCELQHINAELNVLMDFAMGDGDTCEVAQRIESDLQDILAGRLT